MLPLYIVYLMLCSAVGQRNTTNASAEHLSQLLTHFTEVLPKPTGPVSVEAVSVNTITRSPAGLNETIWKRLQHPSNLTCVVSATGGTNIPDKIRYLIDTEHTKLIVYSLVFPYYNATPLISNSTIYKAESWSRVSSRHGQTLLSLSFNYGILSMMTLAVGTTTLKVTLKDEPQGCIARLSEKEQFDMLLHLMLRDFQDVEGPTVKGEERICHEAIVDEDGHAKFIDMCCHEDPATLAVVCEPDIVNIWLRLIQLTLSLIRLGLLFFGPLVLASTVVSITRKKYPYMVKLKEPLTKKAVFRHHKSSDNLGEQFVAKHHLDFREIEGFPKLRTSILEAVAYDVPVLRPVQIRISQYDILVDYNRTLTENRVPVGFWSNIFSALFLCRLRNTGPFRECCSADMCDLVRRCSKGDLKRRRWISFWSRVGLILMVLLIPTPYYLRLFIFYRFECDEVEARKVAVSRLGLEEQFSSNPLHYFTPTHPMLIIVYVTYFFTAAFIGLTKRRDKESPILRILAGAFDDLASLPWTKVLAVMVSNIIWPFQRFGVVGCVVAIVYWPLALPLTVLTYAIYCLPTVYLTVRMIFYSRKNFGLRPKRRLRVRSYRARKQPDKTIRLFDIENLMRRFKCVCDAAEVEANAGEISDDLSDLDRVQSRYSTSDTISVTSTDKSDSKRTFRSCCAHFLVSLLCVAVLYSTLVILSECIGCLVEVAFFTLMGVIVNAGVLLKYVALIILLFAYSQDCFKDVQKNYLKLNKSLFTEVKGRVKDFEQVTSQPSNLQENQGFKSQELSEQAFYEEPDDLASSSQGYWLINDLVLFVDNEDMPRIPKKLFEEVCQIKVAGVPGPVYRGHLMALKRFMVIVFFVFFVFIVVLSFSEAYMISSTNQMLATLAGGFLPLILRTLMGGDKADLELSTLSFKSKLDEVIKNYHQIWPMYDFPFELVHPETASVDSPDVVENFIENPLRSVAQNPVILGSPDVLSATEKPVSYNAQDNKRSENETEINTERQMSRQDSGKQRVTFKKEEKKTEVDLLIDLPESEEWTGLVYSIP